MVQVEAKIKLLYCNRDLFWSIRMGWDSLIIKKFWKYHFIFVKRGIPHLLAVLKISDSKVVLKEYQIGRIIYSLLDSIDCALGNWVSVPVDENGEIIRLPSIGCGL